MEDFMKTVTKKTVIIIDNDWASPLPSIKLLKYLKKSLFGNKIIYFYSLFLLIVVSLIGLNMVSHQTFSMIMTQLKTLKSQLTIYLRILARSYTRLILNEHLKVFDSLKFVL